MPIRHTLSRLAVLGVIAATATACTSSGGGAAHSSTASTSPVAAHINKVVLATHDSWAAPKDLLKQFETANDYTVTVQTNGDAGELTNKLVLTKDSPIGDVVYGIDNTFATRALAAGVFAKYRSPAVTSTQYDIPGGAAYLTPIDWGDVCVNVDDAWFTKHHRTPPTSLDDLVKPAYKGLFVAPGAATSSPGFAFLLATIAHYGENGWQNYWKKLMSNGLKLTVDWTNAFQVDYTAGGGNGNRPIVVSYNSDPVFSIPDGATTPTTHALLDTCFRQVEYAGVLAGAKNPVGARAFIDFLASRQFQESLPDNMYVFPVDPQAKLPATWAKWAKPAPNPLNVPADEITANRATWLTQWSDITS
jgi:thiamine transport system substrate-binding protein